MKILKYAINTIRYYRTLNIMRIIKSEKAARLECEKMMNEVREQFNNR